MDGEISPICVLSLSFSSNTQRSGPRVPSFFSPRGVGANHGAMATCVAEDAPCLAARSGRTNWNGMGEDRYNGGVGGGGSPLGSAVPTTLPHYYKKL